MRPIGWTQLLRSSDTAVVGHRTCGNQWALWRRSGGDRRIRRTGTWEGVLCERWDSRRGSVRHDSPYRGQSAESTREKQESAVTTGYHGPIIILSRRSSAEELEKLPERSRRHKHTPVPAVCPAQTSGICQSIGASPASARSRLICEKHRHPKNFLTDKGEGCAQATTAWCDCVINVRFFWASRPHSTNTTRVCFAATSSIKRSVNRSQPRP